MESFEENLNPSVVALEFNELFSKVRVTNIVSLFIVSVNPYSLLF